MTKLTVGPIGLLPPSATAMGIFQPEKGSGNQLVEGEHVPEDKAIEKWAKELLTGETRPCFLGRWSFGDGIRKQNTKLHCLLSLWTQFLE